MPESIPASLIIDTLKDLFREARAAREAEGWGPSPHEHLGWILSVPDTHQKTVLAALGEMRPRLQKAVARQARLKRTPELRFEPDVVIRAAERVDEVLRSIEPPNDPT